MPLNEAKSYWKAQDDPLDGGRSDAEILGLVKERSEAFDQTIRKRDRRETIAAVLLFLFFSAMLAHPSWVTRAGTLLVLAGTVLIVWMLRRARRGRDDGLMGASLAEVLRAERAKLDAQIRLLSNVLWWYISPLAIGVVLMVGGWRGWSWFTFGYAGFVAVGAVIVYRLNQNAVRHEMLPRREELTRLLRQIEE